MNKIRIQDKFVVIGEIGKGAFSVVYKVTRIADGEIYALKRVPLKDLKPKEIENALNEIRILASIKHPNIVSYKEAFIDNDSQELCIIMNYAGGGDLSAKLKECRERKIRLPEKIILRFFYQLSSAIYELHIRKIIHRDLKTANVLLGSDLKNVQLGDMNVSKIVKNLFAYTQTGTPYYASPEVWRDEPYNIKTDIWSLGCVIYEMMMLKPPFNATDMDGLFKRVQKCAFEPFDNFYSKQLRESVSKLLTVNSHQRPTCEKILNFSVFSDLKILFDEGSTQYKSADNFFKPELIKTIRISDDFAELGRNLPAPRYSNEKIEFDSEKQELNFGGYHPSHQINQEKNGNKNNKETVFKKKGKVQSSNKKIEESTINDLKQKKEKEGLLLNLNTLIKKESQKNKIVLNSQNLTSFMGNNSRLTKSVRKENSSQNQTIQQNPSKEIIEILPKIDKKNFLLKNRIKDKSQLELNRINSSPNYLVQNKNQKINQNQQSKNWGPLERRIKSALENPYGRLTINSGKKNIIQSSIDKNYLNNRCNSEQNSRNNSPLRQNDQNLNLKGINSVKKNLVSNSTELAKSNLIQNQQNQNQKQNNLYIGRSSQQVREKSVEYQPFLLISSKRLPSVNRSTFFCRNFLNNNKSQNKKTDSFSGPIELTQSVVKSQIVKQKMHIQNSKQKVQSAKQEKQRDDSKLKKIDSIQKQNDFVVKNNRQSKANSKTKISDKHNSIINSISTLQTMGIQNNQTNEKDKYISNMNKVSLDNINLKNMRSLKNMKSSYLRFQNSKPNLKSELMQKSFGRNSEKQKNQGLSQLLKSRNSKINELFCSKGEEIKSINQSKKGNIQSNYDIAINHQQNDQCHFAKRKNASVKNIGHLEFKTQKETGMEEKKKNSNVNIDQFLHFIKTKDEISDKKNKISHR